MSKLDEIRKNMGIIKISPSLFIDVKKHFIYLQMDEDGEDEQYCGISNKEIKPLIKALQELIK